jgi:outer membrane murein-binding lipoprotein Lpp
MKDAVAQAAVALHGLQSRAGAEKVAAEVERLNATIRDLARPGIAFTDQPADFAAVLLRNADR